MTLRRLIAAISLTALLATMAPVAPVLANGAASTRNIILGLGAATYLLIQHNRKVHEQQAQQARQQAALAQQRNDAWAAYNAEKRAYENEVAVASALKREVAYQHNVVAQQGRELASIGMQQSVVTQRVAVANPKKGQPTTRQVALVSYGWGTL
ncbi:MAG: hypothetical protein ACYDA5_06030 [Vulcanimicrobiaceae bacterium]